MQFRQLHLVGLVFGLAFALWTDGILLSRAASAAGPDAELMSHYANASLPQQFDAFV
jgi:hypothetical protein